MKVLILTKGSVCHSKDSLFIMREGRFPSKKDMWVVFLLACLPTHIWSIILALREIPALLISLKMWDVLGFLSYSLVFTFFESLFVFCALMILGFVLPRKFIRNVFLAQNTIIILITGLGIVPLHFLGEIFELGTPWDSMILWIWILGYILFLSGLSIAIRRNERVKGFIIALAMRLTSLSIFYLVLDFMAAGILFVRFVF